MPLRRNATMTMMQGFVPGHGPVFMHFETTRPAAGMSSRPYWQPLTDVFEAEGNIVVRMELAGVRPEDTQITLDNARVLTVSGVRREPHAQRRPACYYQMETDYGEFQRRLQLPKAVDADRAQAAFKNGFLEIVLPIAQAQRRPVRFVVAIM